MNGFRNQRHFMSRASAVVALALLFTAIASIPGAARAQPGGEPNLAERLKALAGALPVPSDTQAAIAPADATIEWQDGAMQWTQTYNCITGMVEQLSGEFVGYMGNSDVTFPRVGDRYYGHAVVGVVGNPCGGPYVHIEVVLPPNTTFAIDEQHKVRCFLGNFDTGEADEVPTEQCPQTPGVGTYGAVFDRPGEGPWPVARGEYVAVMFPLISTREMSGSATNSYLIGGIRILDGATSPWDDPKMGVFVAPNHPAIGYADDAASDITGTSARVEATIANHFTAGRAYVDYGTTAAYGRTLGPAEVPAAENSVVVGANLSDLRPKTTYHWRMRFVAADGTVYAGVDQTFVTSGTGGEPPNQSKHLYLPVIQP